jgi:intein/homing endonuclease
LPSLELIDQILDILYKLDEGATLIKQKNNLNFREGIESFNNLYVMIS